MAITSLGFNTPAEHSISIEDFDVTVDNVSILGEKSDSPTNWTVHSTVRASFELRLNLEEALQQSSLPTGKSSPAAVLGAVINWKSSRTGLHGASFPKQLTDGLNEISISLEGSQLGGDLTLRISVILLDNPSPEDFALAPTKMGSKLWENTIRVQLEGDGSQFPTSAFDFAKTNSSYLPATAMWKIDIDPALESHVSSAVRLKLNTGHPRVEEYLKDPSGRDQAEFQKFLRADTIVQLLVFALNSDLPQLELDAQNEGTFAEALLQIYGTYFPGISIYSTRETYLTDPSYVSSTVQASIFDETRRKGK